jgi:hypothetical protein
MGSVREAMYGAWVAVEGVVGDTVLAGSHSAEEAAAAASHIHAEPIVYGSGSTRSQHLVPVQGAVQEQRVLCSYGHWRY